MRKTVAKKIRKIVQAMNLQSCSDVNMYRKAKKYYNRYKTLSSIPEKRG